jgi:hypothetical protein
MLAQVVLVPIAPIYQVYSSVPFASMVLFFGAPSSTGYHLFCS